MAVITAALLDALRTGLQTEFRDAYMQMQAKTFYRDVATVVPSMDASETYGWLGDFPELIEWVGARTIKDIKEHAYQIFNKDWEATVGIKRPHIEDDRLGQYSARVRMMAQAAARKPDQLIAQLMADGASTLCYDGQNFFDTDHPVAANHDGTGAVTTWSNLDASGAPADPYWYLLDTSNVIKPFIFQERKVPELESKEDPSTSDHVFTNNEFLYGVYARHNAGYGFPQMAYASNAALDATNFNAARKSMMEVKADGGRPMGIMPTTLVVPPALQASANEAILAERLANGASNTNFRAVEVRVVPWLT